MIKMVCVTRSCGVWLDHPKPYKILIYLYGFRRLIEFRNLSRKVCIKPLSMLLWVAQQFRQQKSLMLKRCAICMAIGEVVGIAVTAPKIG